MHNKNYLRAFIAIFSLMLIFGVSANAQNKRSNCSDAAITRSINNHISRLKARNPKSRIRIDVSVKNRVVKLKVRSGPRSIGSAIAQHAKGTRCVRKVSLINQPGCSSVGCPDKTYMCNGECVPCKQECLP